MRGKEELFDEAPRPERGKERAPSKRGRKEPARERWQGSLVDAARPVLEAALLLHRGGAQFDPVFSEFRRTVTGALDDFRIQARRTGVPDDEIQQAEYALVVFADEMVSISTWSGKDQWDARHLEQERFNTALAGTEFFERIDKLRDSQRQALEVFYVCLRLGFEGGYRGDDSRRGDLGAKMEALRRRLGVPTPSWEEPVFQEAYRPLRSSEQAQRTVGRVWLFLGIAGGAAFLILYIVFWLLLQQTAGESASILSRG